MENIISLTDREIKKLKPIPIGERYIVGDLVKLDNNQFIKLSAASRLVNHVKETVRVNNLVFRQ